MPAAVVTINTSVAASAHVTGKYVCDAVPALTNINVGFLPSRVEILNATDRDQIAIWTSDMADGSGIKTTAGAVAIMATGGVSALPGTDGVNHGFSVGTDVGVQEASKTFSFIAFR